MAAVSSYLLLHSAFCSIECYEASEKLHSTLVREWVLKARIMVVSLRVVTSRTPPPQGLGGAWGGSLAHTWSNY